MGGGIDQRALVVLAVNLDQRSTHRLQGLHADRLIVDEGAGAAISKLYAAQDHLAGGFRTRLVEPVVTENCRSRVAFGDIEHRGDLTLFDAMTNKAGVPAPPERQRERIQQNGFAGTGE